MLVIAFLLLYWSACLQVVILMFVSLLHVKKPSSLLLVYGKEKCKFLLATCLMTGSAEDFVDDLFIQFSLGMVHIYAFTFRVRFGMLKTLLPELWIQLERKNRTSQYLLCKFVLTQFLYFKSSVGCCNCAWCLLL